MSPQAALVVTLVALSLSSLARSELATENDTAPTTSQPLESLASSMRSLQSQLSNNEQVWVQTLSETLAKGARSLQEPLGFLGKLMPKSSALLAKAQQVTTESIEPSTTELPATTSAPRSASSASGQGAQSQRPFQLNKNLQDISTVLSSGARLLETPIRMFNGMLSQSANLTRAGVKAADSLVKAAGSTSKQLATGGRGDGHSDGGNIHIDSHSATGEYNHPINVHSIRGGPPPEDDWKYYEYAGPYEPYAYRRPKYFSKECQFRFACEVGKLMKPLTYPVTRKVETSRFVQDLQNRYTRAMTYGTLRGNCERYYCVLVALLGGPAGFASGVAEIVNRAVNSDMYDIGGLSRRKWVGV